MFSRKTGTCEDTLTCPKAGLQSSPKTPFEGGEHEEQFEERCVDGTRHIIWGNVEHWNSSSESIVSQSQSLEGGSSSEANKYMRAWLRQEGRSGAGSGRHGQVVPSLGRGSSRNDPGRVGWPIPEDEPEPVKAPNNVLGKEQVGRVSIDMNHLRGVDCNGRPILVSGTLCYDNSTCSKPPVDMHKPQEFLRLQAMAILKRALEHHPYESLEGRCTSQEAVDLGNELVSQLRAAVRPTGFQVISFSLTSVLFAGASRSAAPRGNPTAAQPLALTDEPSPVASSAPAAASTATIAGTSQPEDAAERSSAAAPAAAAEAASSSSVAPPAASDPSASMTSQWFKEDAAQDSFSGSDLDEELLQSIAESGQKQERPAPLTKEQLEELRPHIPVDQDGTLTSLGSQEHATNNCKPCLFAAMKFGCQKGVICEFCHFSHKRRRKLRPCKGKRERIQKIITNIEQEIEANPDCLQEKVESLPPSIVDNPVLKFKVLSRLRTHAETVKRRLLEDPQASSRLAGGSDGFQRLSL